MLSIIIITKNEERCLPRLLESIKRQSLIDYEVIVSDANSTDRTREIALGYGCKVVDGGLPSIGRNNGARVARGDILLFLDADVVLPDGFLRNYLREFNRKKIDCSSVVFLPLSDKFVDKTLHLFSNGWMLLMQYFYPYAPGFFIICKKSIFQKVGGFNEGMVLSEDHEFVNLCAKHGKFRVMVDQKIFVDVRRLEIEGRAKIFFKYVYAGGSRLILRNKYTPKFDYVLNGGVNVGELDFIKKKSNLFFLK